MEIRKFSTRLLQLADIARSPVWDGNLISKSETERLVQDRLIERCRGFYVLTMKGLTVLDVIGLIKR